MRTNFYFLILTTVLILALSRVTADQEEPIDQDTPTSPIAIPASTAAPTAKPNNKPNKKSKVSEILDLPSGCSNVLNKISCTNLTSIPSDVFRKYINTTEISITSSQIENLNFNLFSPMNNLTRLDLSKNKIKTIIENSSKKGLYPLSLKSLNLSDNKIQDLKAFSTWTFTNLTELDLSFNPIVDLDASVFNRTAQLQTLKLAATNLTSIHERTFWPLTQLKTLDLSGADIVNHYGNKQFSKNQQLKSLNLSNNRLIEVPFALRAISSIQNLTLNGNLMTSLRQSDLINQTSIEFLEVKNCKKLTKIDEFTFGEMFNLKKLTISNNEKFNYISKDAFKSEKNSNIEAKMLSLVDLSSNNFTTMSNPKEFTSLKFAQIRLNNNPWHCSCELRWFETLPINERDSVHCKSPQAYIDIEVSQYLTTVDCEAEESGYHRVIVTLFLVFLFGLAVAVFVQKSEFCRRLLWRDQYGTIYYTKASFPPETA